MTTATQWAARALMARRRATMGPHSPMFYSEPLHIVSAQDVWMRGADGVDYLDAYNNVPHVGHCNPAVVTAMADQARRLNIHTRYLTAPVVEYAERLLATFEEPLDKIFFTNSGSEANELAFRIARQHTGNTGVLVTDFSYHGNTMGLAVATTGLPTAEPLGSHVRALSIPDLEHDSRPESEILASALAGVARAIQSLQATGHGVSVLLFDPLFSTEGLLRTPRGFVEGLVRQVRAAGGLVIADEVQSGFGRTGSHMWGHRMFDFTPDFVVLGKPMGNGHPLGATITTTALLEEFGRSNVYFNTFAGNPVSAAVGLAVLDEMGGRELQQSAGVLGTRAREALERLSSGRPYIRAVRGTGLFFGLELSDPRGQDAAGFTKKLVEDMRRRGVLISKIGPDDNVLKIRPPMVFQDEHLDLLIERLADSFDAFEAEDAHRRRPSEPARAAIVPVEQRPTCSRLPDLPELTTQMLVGGTWMVGSETTEVVSPIDGHRLALVSAAGHGEADEAVASARAALHGPWSKVSGVARGAMLERLAMLVERDADALARIEAADTGKPLVMARTCDVPSAVATFRHFAGWADKVQGDTIPTAGYLGIAKTHSYTVREPVGVIAVILSAHAPLRFASRHLAPALAAGNTVVIKPAEGAPLSVLHLGKLIVEAGFPPGVVNIVPGRGPVAGAALVAHKAVDKISFTGSPDVGRAVQKSAADTFKRVALELSGKIPHLVMEDADIASAIRGVAEGLLFHHGDVRAASTRVFVHASRYDEVVDGLAKAFDAQVLGDPFDPRTTVGPVANHAEQERVREFVELARAAGGRVVTGGGRKSGSDCLVEPTLVADLGVASVLAREEVSGPVALVMAFGDADEAIRLVNGTRHGQGATIWTQDVSSAYRLTQKVKAGVVRVNGPTAKHPVSLSSGVDVSDAAGEFGWAAILADTEEKTVTVVL